jgi:hypothetical protein
VFECEERLSKNKTSNQLTINLLKDLFEWFDSLKDGL